MRAAHRVPPLAWDPRLAATAEAWAERRVFEHGSGGYGENLAWGTAEAYGPTDHVRRRYEEIRSCDFRTGRSVDGGPVGHFTQLVRRETTHLGCGFAQCGDAVMGESLSDRASGACSAGG